MQIFFPNASISYPPSIGADIHRYQLVKNLSERGHQVHTLVPDQNPYACPSPRRISTMIKNLARCDVLYCRLEESPNATTQLTLLPKRFLIPRKTVVVWELNVSLIGDATLDKRSEAVKKDHTKLFKKAAKRVDLAIGVTRKLCEQARDLLGIENTHVIANGSDPTMFRPGLAPPAGLDLPSDRLQVASIGSNPNAYHDVELIQNLCDLIDQQNLPIDVHVFGKSESLFSRDDGGCLKFHGPVSYMQLPAYLAQMQAGLCLYNIRADGNSPLKLFDFLASGCVPLCSVSEPIEYVLKDTHAGWMENWSAQSLVQALMKLHENADLQQTMAQAGRQLIEQKHGWSHVAKTTEQVLASLIQKRR